MKIAFVSQPLDGSYPPPRNSLAILTYEIARRLARSNDVSVFTTGGHFSHAKTYAQGVCYLHIPIAYDILLQRLFGKAGKFRNVKHPFFASGLYYLGYIFQIAKAIKRENFDIVHMHSFSQFVPVIRYFNPNIKIVLHMHCEWLTQLDQIMIERRLKELNLIVSCSEYITEKIRKRFPVFADISHTIYNGVDVDHFKAENDNGHTNRNGTHRLLFVGRVSPEKGVHVLLKAIGKVVRQYPQVHLDIIGGQKQLPFEYLIALSNDKKVTELSSFYDGASLHSYSKYIQDTINSWGLTKNVSCIASIPHSQLSRYYQEADAFIFPSVWDEPFGMPPVEAMSFGVPVVATRSGGIVETVEDGKTGLLTEPGDSDALAGAILRLLDNDNLRKTMGQAGRKRVMKFFSWDRITEDLLVLYKSIS